MINIKGLGASANAKYIQSMKVNSEPDSNLWITMETLKEGSGTILEFVMDTQPNYGWGTDPSNIPPSFAPLPVRH